MRTISPTGTTIPEGAAERSSAQEKRIAQDTPVSAPKTPNVHPVDPDATLINAAPTTPTRSPAALHLSSNPNPMALLLLEPGFANTGQLTAWANLPDSVQRETLDTWMCQQLEDPAFIALVKRIDESGQASLFGRSVGVDL